MKNPFEILLYSQFYGDYFACKTKKKNQKKKKEKEGKESCTKNIYQKKDFNFVPSIDWHSMDEEEEKQKHILDIKFSWW